jgi:opacity protein-like surface antigen
MKGFLLAVLVLLISASLVHAAEIVTIPGTRNLVFQFSGLSELGLGGYQGGVGGRYYTSNRTALRAGLIFSSASVTLKDGSDEATATTTDIGGELVMEMHMPAGKSVSPYVGGGASFESVSTSVESFEGPTVSAFGLFAVAGFEWGFAESLSLGGEYRLGLRSVSGMVEEHGYDMSTLAIGISTASVFLSVTL